MGAAWNGLAVCGVVLGAWSGGDCCHTTGRCHVSNVFNSSTGGLRSDDAWRYVVASKVDGIYGMSLTSDALGLMLWQAHGLGPSTGHGAELDCVSDTDLESQFVCHYHVSAIPQALRARGHR